MNPTEFKKIKKIEELVLDIIRQSGSLGIACNRIMANLNGKIRDDGPDSFGGTDFPEIDTEPTSRTDSIAQPKPMENDMPYVKDLVLKDFIDRAQFGHKKYGTYLQPNNGRNALIDAYQEAMDLVLYLRQALFERDGK
jgi:hypothetical protein